MRFLLKKAVLCSLLTLVLLQFGAPTVLALEDVGGIGTFSAAEATTSPSLVDDGTNCSFTSFLTGDTSGFICPILVAINWLIDGIAWLPRILVKARLKLRGEMPADLMYGCGGDRQ